MSLASVAVVMACAAVLVFGTRHWPQISDAVLMHYVVFLVRHGMAPYRQVVDVNWPGSYAVDWAAATLFGGSTGGWRCFDWLLTGLAGTVLAGEGRRAGSTLAGVLAAGLFAVWHLRDGVAQAGQRDYILTVLLLLGYAALRRVTQVQPLVWAGVFGLCCGSAAMIKPQAGLFWVLLLPLLPGLRVRLASLGGFLLPLGAACGWLLAHGALRAFLDAAGGLMPYHAGMARHTLPFLLLHAMPWQFLPLVCLAVALMTVRRSWGGFAQRAALLGMLGGAASFLAQGKAYPYHRAPLLAFTLLLFAAELGAAMRRPVTPVLRWATLAVLAYAGLWFAPEATARALRQDWRTTPSLDALQADLANLHAGNREVQCMDTMAGCITVLDRLHFVQATGFLYDCYVFTPGPSTVEDRLRSRFRAELERHPPRVFVVTDQWCFDRDPRYRKLVQWPWFAAFLDRNYRLAEQRSFPPGSKQLATWPFDYRVYVKSEK